jgi:hypothetical protein
MNAKLMLLDQRAPAWRCLALLMALGLLPLLGLGQEAELREINQTRLKLNTVNMYVLGGWAVGNMAVSGIMRGRTQGSTRYFHEMNVFWNVVNLGLAAGALYGVYTSDPGSYDLWQTFDEQQKLEKILLFNLALNFTYMTAGGYLMERSRRDEPRADQFQGYGQSLLLQGGFLLLFDATQYFLHHSSNHGRLQQLLSQAQLSLGPDSFSLMLSF